MTKLQQTVCPLYPKYVTRFFQQGCFPTDWNTEIKPLFKKGDKTGISIYRPISFRISLCKIVEKITYKRLNDHININYVLVKEQFGFRTNSSADIAAYILINNILSSLNNKLLVGGLFCDFQKAFCCLNHEILSKMRFYAI